MSADSPELGERYPAIDGSLEHRIAYVLRSGVFSSPIAIQTFKDVVAERTEHSGQIVEVHHHDLEAHAASFNEGWDEAVKQGLAEPRPQEVSEPLYDLATRTWSHACPCIADMQVDPDCPWHGRERNNKDTA